MNTLKKNISILVLVVMMLATIPIAVFAASETVYYKGTPVYWEYGRKCAVYSYSEVQSHVYEHSATANSEFSGWKLPGVLAEASKYVGTTTARCYWDCRE